MTSREGLISSKIVTILTDVHFILLSAMGSSLSFSKAPLLGTMLTDRTCLLAQGRAFACEYIPWKAGAALAGGWGAGRGGTGEGGAATDGALPVYDMLRNCHFAQGGKKNYLIGQRKIIDHRDGVLQSPHFCLMKN